MQTKSNDDTEVSDTGVCKLEPAENRHRNCLYAGRGKISLNCFTRKRSIHTDLVWVESHMKIFFPSLSLIHTHTNAHCDVLHTHTQSTAEPPKSKCSTKW